MSMADQVAASQARIKALQEALAQSMNGGGGGGATDYPLDEDGFPIDPNADGGGYDEGDDGDRYGEENNSGPPPPSSSAPEPQNNYEDDADLEAEMAAQFAAQERAWEDEKKREEEEKSVAHLYKQLEDMKKLTAKAQEAKEKGLDPKAAVLPGATPAAAAPTAAATATTTPSSTAYTTKVVNTWNAQDIEAWLHSVKTKVLGYVTTFKAKGWTQAECDSFVSGINSAFTSFSVPSTVTGSTLLSTIDSGSFTATLKLSHEFIAKQAQADLQHRSRTQK